MANNDYGHLDEVPFDKHTLRWFKRDIKTIKRSVKATVFSLHWIGIVTLVATTVCYYLATNTLFIPTILLYSLIFLPVTTLGYLLLHIMKTKGYDIRGPGTGP